MDAWVGSINDHGQVVGDTVVTGTDLTAATWREDLGWADLGLFGGAQTEAGDINSNGDVVGSAFTDPGSLATNRAVRWTQRTNLYQQLPDLAGGTTLASQAIAMNNDGYSVGFAEEATGMFRPVRWTPWGSATQLFGDNDVQPSSYLAEAYGINDAGQVVGYYCWFVSCTRRGFLWDPLAGPADIGNLGADPTVATNINDHAQVVGWSTTGGSTRRAFLWDQATGMVDLFAGAGVGNSYALGINNWGQVVGTYFSEPGNNGWQRGFFYDPDWGLFDIGDIHPTTTSHTSATAINNQRVITGWSIDDTGQPKAFVRGTGDRPDQP